MIILTLLTFTFIVLFFLAIIHTRSNSVNSISNLLQRDLFPYTAPSSSVSKLDLKNNNFAKVIKILSGLLTRITTISILRRDITNSESSRVILAMPGSSVYTTIVGMANYSGSLDQIQAAYPELSLFDILNFLQKGLAEGYLNDAGQDMINRVNSKIVELATPIVEQVVNSAPVAAPAPEQALLGGPLKETLWSDWIIPIGITVIVVVTVGSIVYYIYNKKKKKTPPDDVTDGGNSLDMPGSSSATSNEIIMHKSINKISHRFSLKVIPIILCSIIFLIINYGHFINPLY